MSLEINEQLNTYNSFPVNSSNFTGSPSFCKKNGTIEKHIDKVVQHIDEEKEKKHNKTAIAVGSSVVGLSIFVTLFNPKISSKLMGKLKGLQAEAKAKFNKSKGEFVKGKFYKIVSKAAEKITKIISFSGNTNSVKDTYFKQLCTEEKLFGDVKNEKRRKFLLSADKVIRSVFKKPHETLTRWGDNLAKHTVKRRYNAARENLNKFENFAKSYYEKLPGSKKREFDKILQKISADRSYFSLENLDQRFGEYENLMGNLNSDMRQRWVRYRKGFKNKDVKTSEHLNRNLSFWAEDMTAGTKEGVNIKGKAAVDKLFGNPEGIKGGYRELAELITPELSESERVKFNKYFQKAEKGLRKANKRECLDYFDKKRDLILGSAPTDIVTAIIGLTMGGIALTSADNKDQRISRLLTGVFPAAAGIGTGIALTAMLFSGPKGMILGAVVGAFMSLVGNKINNFRLSIKGVKNNDTAEDKK